VLTAMCKTTMRWQMTCDNICLERVRVSFCLMSQILAPNC
jgi:hypothetical protein